MPLGFFFVLYQSGWGVTGLTLGVFSCHYCMLLFPRICAASTLPVCPASNPSTRCRPTHMLPTFTLFFSSEICLFLFLFCYELMLRIIGDRSLMSCGTRCGLIMTLLSLRSTSFQTYPRPSHPALYPVCHQARASSTMGSTQAAILPSTPSSPSTLSITSLNPTHHRTPQPPLLAHLLKSTGGLAPLCWHVYRLCVCNTSMALLSKG